MTEENKTDPNLKNDAKPDLTVDIGGEVITCASVEQKSKVIAARDADKAASKLLRDREAAAEAKAKAAEEKAANETRRAQALEAAKKDEAEKAEEIFAKPHRQRAELAESKLVKLEIMNMIRSRGDVVEKSIPDVVAQLTSSHGFKLEGDVVKTADGKDIKSVVDDFIKDRDYLRVAKTATGTGANKAAPLPGYKPATSGLADITAGLSKVIKQ